MRFLFLFVAFFSYSLAWAQDPALRTQMYEVYSSFADLQWYLSSEERFENSEHEDRILKLVDELRESFHSTDLQSTEPGFTSTLEVLSEMLDDSRNRFVEGRKAYSLWRLKTAVHYCITCHTRYSVPVDFQGALEAPKGASSFEKAEFYLATRQFEKAADTFLKVVYSDHTSQRRMDALRKWLVVYTRVHPDAHLALKELSRVRSSANLTSYEDEEIREWIVSLRRWSNESRGTVKPIRKAENLIRQGLATHDPLHHHRDTVALLRATAILHQQLEKKPALADADRAQTLYLLGLAYSELPFFFVNELPEMFLEQCIRENPGTKRAKKSYRLYQKLITLGYTGSSGTRVPKDVQEDLQRLHDLANGVQEES